MEEKEDDIGSILAKRINGGSLSTYDSFMKEITKYLDDELLKELSTPVLKNNRMALTDDKKKGIQTLLNWVDKDEMYRIGSREMEGYMIIDQLKKILLIEGYDKIDKELLNNLRGLYTNEHTKV